MTKPEYQELSRKLAAAVMKRYDGDKSKGLTQTEATDLLEECVNAVIDMA